MFPNLSIAILSIQRLKLSLGAKVPSWYRVQFAAPDLRSSIQRIPARLLPLTSVAVPPFQGRTGAQLQFQPNSFLMLGSNVEIMFRFNEFNQLQQFSRCRFSDFIAHGSVGRGFAGADAKPTEVKILFLTRSQGNVLTLIDDNALEIGVGRMKNQSGLAAQKQGGCGEVLQAHGDGFFVMRALQIGSKHSRDFLFGHGIGEGKGSVVSKK